MCQFRICSPDTRVRSIATQLKQSKWNQLEAHTINWQEQTCREIGFHYNQLAEANMQRNMISLHYKSDPPVILTWCTDSPRVHRGPCQDPWEIVQFGPTCITWKPRTVLMSTLQVMPAPRPKHNGTVIWKYSISRRWIFGIDL